MATRLLKLSGWLVALAIVFALVAPVEAEAPANMYFEQTWNRTDHAVAEGQANRTWMWGPEGFTGELQEAYAGSPGAERVVQYFDKSRMEITDPDADPTSIWYVTNGLLVKELVSGQLQSGDDSFEQYNPADINVAGDADAPYSPSYATFNMLRTAEPLDAGAPVTWRVDHDGNVTDDPATAGYGVTAAEYVEATNHRVASPFWTFMNSTGLVYENGAYLEAVLFENPYYATGLPITEAYWTTVPLGGVDAEVLVQCFERRCLTYTPGNPDGWQVEAGNVGQHYYHWRYQVIGGPNPTPDDPSPGEVADALEVIALDLSMCMSEQLGPSDLIDLDSGSSGTAADAIRSCLDETMPPDLSAAVDSLVAQCLECMSTVTLNLSQEARNALEVGTTEEQDTIVFAIVDETVACLIGRVQS